MLFYIGRRAERAVRLRIHFSSSPTRKLQDGLVRAIFSRRVRVTRGRGRSALSQSDERGRRHGGRRRCSRCRRSSRLPRLVQQQYVTHFVRPTTGFLPAATPPPSVHRQRQSSPGRGKRALPSFNHRPLCFLLLERSSHRR